MSRRQRRPDGDPYLRRPGHVQGHCDRDRLGRHVGPTGAVRLERGQRAGDDALSERVSDRDRVRDGACLQTRHAPTPASTYLRAYLTGELGLIRAAGTYKNMSA